MENISTIVNIIVIGDASVGKTNLVSRFVNDKFNEDSKPTIGADFSTKLHIVNGKYVNVKFWDTAGQEKFKSIGTKFYKDANGVILVYDVTRKESYENLNKWVAEVKEKAPKDLSIMLLGNKIDLIGDKEVSTEDGKRFSEIYGYYFLETSAKNSTNVEKAFNLLIESASEKLLKESEDQEFKDYSIARNSIQHINKEALVKKNKKCC
jgi:small GTP-binding protein